MTIRDEMAKVIAEVTETHPYEEYCDSSNGVYPNMEGGKIRNQYDVAQAILDMPQVKALVDAADNALPFIGYLPSNPETVKNPLRDAIAPFKAGA